jgi:hypothetical protein
MPTKPTIHESPGAARARQQAQRQQEQARNQQVHRSFYWSARYRRFRRWLLSERPVCEDCQRAASVDIHHTRGLAQHPEDLCDQEQTLCLCHSCHSQRTARGE